MKWKKWLIAAVFCCSLLPSLAAGAKEDMIRLQNDVLSLQNQVRLLQKSIDENGGSSKVLMTQVQEQLLKMSKALEETRASQVEQAKSGNDNVEEILNEIRAMSVKFEDLEMRVGLLFKKTESLEALVNEALKARAASQDIPPGGVGKGSNLTPEQLFSLAKNDYVQGNYDLAVQGFQDFLANYKDSESADKAQYYIGDCLYNQNKWGEAIGAFNQVTALFPKSEQAAAAYLKSGLAYLKLNDKDAASNQFKTVMLKYPDSTEAKIARENLQALGMTTPAKPRKR